MDFMKSPEWLGRELFASDEFAALETLVGGYMKSDTRGDDGRHALYLLTSELSNWFGLVDESFDRNLTLKLKEWNAKFPTSALQPVVAAMQVRATAWRARGTGFSSTVTEEGWRLFRDRNQRAWKILMDNKTRSSALPTWYEEAIRVGTDIDVPAEELRELFDEGIRRHPGYYAIYFAYARPFSPRWGGDWDTADEFIREQTSAKTNKEGDVLYARLYWLADQYAAGSSSFFEDSHVNWPKMRRGFEQLMKAHPKGARNYASFVSYACRAKDATTYAMLRPKVDPGHFKDVAPDGISLEVCDARFMKKA